MSQFSERLAECRKAKKIKQREAAEVIGVSESAYASYEHGRNTPGPEAIAKLAEYFDVSTDYLLGLSDRRHMTPTIAAHSDDPHGLPPEAQEEVLQYIEFIKQKYGIEEKNE